MNATTRPHTTRRNSRHARELLADEQVENKRGIWEFLLGGEQDTKLLHVRVFDKSTVKAVYVRQTERAKKSGVSNCSLCAVGTGSNKTRVYRFDEMEADHVAAWSKGGGTSVKNC